MRLSRYLFIEDMVTDFPLSMILMYPRYHSELLPNTFQAANETSDLQVIRM